MFKLTLFIALVVIVSANAAYDQVVAWPSGSFTPNTTGTCTAANAASFVTFSGSAMTTMSTTASTTTTSGTTISSSVTAADKKSVTFKAYDSSIKYCVTGTTAAAAKITADAEVAKFVAARDTTAKQTALIKLCTLTSSSTTNAGPYCVMCSAAGSATQPTASTTCAAVNTQTNAVYTQTTKGTAPQPTGAAGGACSYDTNTGTNSACASAGVSTVVASSVAAVVAVVAAVFAQ
jgi:hypothetical protein